MDHIRRAEEKTEENFWRKEEFPKNSFTDSSNIKSFKEVEEGEQERKLLTPSDSSFRVLEPYVNSKSFRHKREVTEIN